jgi:subtilisin family serine protease
VSVQASAANLDQLQALAPAAQVWQSRKIKLARPGAQPQQQQAQGPLASPPCTSLACRLASSAATPNYTVHSSTGVDVLHAAGLFGKGVRIASVDTGIDYTVPAVGFLGLLPRAVCERDGFKLTRGWCAAGWVLRPGLSDRRWL